MSRGHTLSRDALLRRLREDTSSATHRLAAFDTVHLPSRALERLEAHLSSMPQEVEVAEVMSLGVARERSTDDRRLAGMLWLLVCDAYAELDASAPGRLRNAGSEGVVHADLIHTGPVEVGHGGLDWNVVVGDLTVDGTLTMPPGQSLFVSGDVYVTGSVISPGNPRTHDGLVSVGGSLRGGESISVTCDLFVRGRVEAPIVTFLGQHGSAWLMSGAAAIYFDESFHSGWSASVPDAPCVLNDDMALGVAPEREDQGDYFQMIYTFWADDEAWTATLRETIRPDVLEACGLADGALTSMSDDGFKDRLWEALNVEVRSLEERFTAHALEVFRNRVGPWWRGGRWA